MTRGADDARRFFHRWLGAFDEYTFEVEKIVDAGDDVFVLMREHGSGKGSGAMVELRLAQVWTFQNGKVSRYRGFQKEADALRAAGLED